MALPRLNRLSVAARVIRLIARTLRQWPWVILVLGLMSPISPHIRWDYRYRQNHPNILFDCRYLGIRGFADRRQSGDCPVITLIHTNSQIF